MTLSGRQSILNLYIWEREEGEKRKREIREGEGKGREVEIGHHHFVGQMTSFVYHANSN